LPWAIAFEPQAAKELRKLDRSVAARILRTLEHRIATLDDPRAVGKRLSMEGVYWRWRVGDYRLVGLVEDQRLRILIVRIAHRRRVYR
jgi:mRNA interferase RelE/StbE